MAGRPQPLFIVSGDFWGGAEKMTVGLLSALRSQQVAARALAFNEGLTAQRLREAGAETLVVDEGLPFPVMVAQAYKALWGQPVSLIHSHGYKENILAAALALLLGRPPLVSTMHGLPELPGARAPLKHRVASGLNFTLLRRRFAATVAVTEDIRRTLVEHLGLPAARVRVIYNGIPVPSLNGRPPIRSPLIGSAGRLYPVKDFPLLLEVAARVCAKRPGVVFQILGDGPQRPALEAMIRAKGLKGEVVLLGFQPDPLPFFESLSIYLNTSRHEGMPLAVLEAMACEVPVVAPRVGGLAEMIEDGQQGLLAEGRGAEQLAESCLRLIDNDALRRRLGEAARARVAEQFSLEGMGQGYRRLYKELTQAEGFGG